MRVLLVGSGGREHALAWKLAQSRLCDALYCAPGNIGMEECAECVDIAADDIAALVAFAVAENIDLVVAGPEVPLVAGLSDALLAENIKVFGPSKAAAQLEGSKQFMKDLCSKYNISTAAYGVFTKVQDARDFILDQGAPIVVKADGLAAGKGVIIAQTTDEAIAAAEDMLSGHAFGGAGARIVIEEFMDGEEVSVFAISDGKTVLPLTTAQDHKRAFDNDEGPNTGGMGAYSPAHMMTDALLQQIMDDIISPTAKAMLAEGMPFQGIFYAGIMLVEGQPRLLEYNIRFGDPECQPIMMRMQSDLLALLDAAASGKLDTMKDKLKWDAGTALCVVMASEGYPSSYQKNTVIKGIEKADCMPHVKVFHAGTARNDAEDIVNIGGRVLGITATGEDVERARKHAYDAIAMIDWPDGFCRSDIAWRALRMTKKKAV